MPSPSQKFLHAVARTLDFEGGYVNDPLDAGGETKYGISKRQFPDLNVYNLTREKAQEIYQREYWDKNGYDRIDDNEVAAKVFDLAVNMGAKTAHLLLQRALRANHEFVTEDGILGAATLRAVNTLPPMTVLAGLRAEAAGYYRSLASKDNALKRFEKGWLRRAYD